MPAANRTDQLVRPHHVVTAVLVAHDGVRWLPTTLHAVKTQRRPVQRFVAVDTGSRDDTAALLDRSVGPSSVIRAPRHTGFGDAVRMAVAAFAGAPGLASTRADAGGPVEWIWLLHDDSAPDVGALETLLELADDMPSAAVIGPKLRGWDDHRRLVEIGLTIDRGGRRETGLEPGEVDHGQHDGDRDVLAVSTAGMLVRRDVWEALGGLDPALPLFRDDLDFGWRANLAGYRVVVCARALMFHAEAAAGGARALATITPHRRRLDRQGALYAMLANGAGVWLPLIAVRLFIGSLLRAIGFVLMKRPFDAWDELCALAFVYGRPHVIARARLVRRGGRQVPSRDVQRLLASRGTRIRHYLDAASGRLAMVGRRDDEATDERGLLRRIAAQPVVLLVVALLVVSLIAERSVWGGTLFGGALLPAPGGARDLWHTYTENWHATGFGSSAPAPPYLAILAAVATLLLGSAGLAVRVLLLGGVVLAGLSSYAAARFVVSSRRVRMWVGATYALSPVAFGAISGGRLGTAVAIAVLPWVLVSAARAVLPEDARRIGMRAAWAAALPLTIGAAFEPLLYVLLLPVLLAALVAAVVAHRTRVVVRALVVIVAPFLLLMPWSTWVWKHPGLLAVGVGRSAPDLQSPSLQPFNVLLLHPGGPGLPPLWLDVVVLLVGLAGLLQLTRPAPAQLGWLLTLVGLIGGLVVAHVHVQPPGAAAGHAVAGWPGIATALMVAGLLMSAAVAGTRLRRRLATTSFGWRQPVALVATAAAVATPVAAGAWWLDRGTGSLLRADTGELLPAFVTDATTARDEPRTLVLRPSPSGPSGGVSYALVRQRPPQLGDADLPPHTTQVATLDTAVGDLTGGFGARAAAELAHAGIRAVLVPATGDGGIAAKIAAGGGLLPQTDAEGWKVWQVETDAGRLAIVSTSDDVWQLPDLPAGAQLVGRHATPITVPYAPAARLLVLAEAPSPQWRATLVRPASSGVRGGAPLAASVYDGMQAFTLPATGGQVVVTRAPDRRANWLLFELIGLIVVVMGAVPAGRRAAEQQRVANRQARSVTQAREPERVRA